MKQMEWREGKGTACIMPGRLGRDGWVKAEGGEGKGRRGRGEDRRGDRGSLSTIHRSIFTGAAERSGEVRRPRRPRPPPPASSPPQLGRGGEEGGGGGGRWF